MNPVQQRSLWTLALLIAVLSTLLGLGYWRLCTETPPAPAMCVHVRVRFIELNDVTLETLGVNWQPAREAIQE